MKSDKTLRILLLWFFFSGQALSSEGHESSSLTTDQMMQQQPQSFEEVSMEVHRIPKELDILRDPYEDDVQDILFSANPLPVRDIL